MYLGLRKEINKYPLIEQLTAELPEYLISRMMIRICNPKEMIIGKCEENKCTYVILEGICSTVQTTENGVRYVLRKATVGDVIGLSGVFPKAYDFSANIVAKTRVVAMLIPQDVLNECYGKYPAFTINLTKRVMTRLQALITVLSECNNYPSSLGLITWVIYNYSFYLRVYPSGYTGPVVILESRKNISDFLGINIRSVQRFLNKLVAEKLIDIVSGKIHVDASQYERLKVIKENWFESCE